MSEDCSSNPALPSLLGVQAQVAELRQSGWLGLPPDKKAFAVAYVENGYSYLKAAEALGMTTKRCWHLERDPLVLALVQDIQKQQEGIDTLNQQWVDSKIREMMPMVMGEVAVPMVDMKEGIEFEAKKFMPEIAVRLLELKSPRKELGNAKGKGGVNVQINFGALGVGEPQPQVVINAPEDDE